MTEGIYSWIQSLACYFVILSAVLNLLPDNSYKKYVQYYMGLLLILVLLSPLLKLGGIQEQVDAYAEEFWQELEEEREQWEDKARQWQQEFQGGERVVTGQEVVP
ncbi:MAG TPA: stage III sporulation protein AF [Candidatus Blautia pullicola]|jgi:stage III sporulation protein AF|uniref:Stage III sporulation protein AF n=1 Tax=Candidatus Blautia pullicola TaxID=2838498 RepID=A0A9D2FSW1_9FIRM|nr:stage III sporulation protein AF [Candidatus Blautia pullicola]